MLPVCFAQSVSLTYDANGNLVTGDGFYREYNSVNQLSRIRLSNSTGTILETYLYDPVEEKVLIKNVSMTNGTWKETVYYWFDEYVEVNNVSGWYNYTYVEHEGQRIAEMQGNTKLFTLGDHLGSSSVIASDANASLQNSLVSYYQFEGNAYDYSGNNDGTVSGAAITTGKVNNAYDFDGANDKIDIKYNQSLNFSNSPFSVAAWIKYQKSGRSEFIVSSYNWSSFNGVLQKAWALFEYSNTSMQFVLYHNGSDANTTSRSVSGLTPGTWYHVAGVWNQTAVKLYINGKLNGTTTGTKGPLINNVPTPVRIGDIMNNYYPFNGTVDEVGIWNRALTSAEIASIYNSSPVSYVVESTSYTPYGSIISGGNQSRYDYTGQEYDSVIGDYDYHARRYKAEWGKFLQPDTILPNVYDPQQLNRYSYVRNNPYKYTDPDGHIITVLYYASVVALAIWQWGDTVGYGVISAGYLIMATKDSSQRNWDKFSTSTENLLASAIPFSNTGKGWVSLLSDWNQFTQDWSNQQVSVQADGTKDVTTPPPSEENRKSNGANYRGSSLVYGELRLEAENAKEGETAADILKRWREKNFASTPKVNTQTVDTYQDTGGWDGPFPKSSGGSHSSNSGSVSEGTANFWREIKSKYYS